MPGALLEAAGLACERGGRTLFRGLDLSAAPGELLRIAGPNGAGKTSLLRMLCGLLAPAAGEVRWNGEPIGSLDEEYSRHVVYLGHAPAVKAELTAAENLAFACIVSGVTASAAATDGALARFGVPGGKLVGKLSQGQRRRAALARLVLCGAVPLWLLDEPFAALDTDAAALAAGIIEQHVAGGGAVLYTTHQEAALDARARVVRLGEGS